MKLVQNAIVLVATLFSPTLTLMPFQTTTLTAVSIVMMVDNANAQQRTVPGIGAVVRHRESKALIAEGVSDKKGQIIFKDLEPGKYIVTVGDNKPQNFTIRKGDNGIVVIVFSKKHNYVGHVTLLR